MARAMRPTLRFLGATRTVTGSRFLVETPTARVLIDCGMFQGLREDRDRNRQPFPVPPETVDAVVLTHAHIDHSGHLPALARDGFTGAIHCSPDTEALCRILLTDAAHLQEEEARYANAKGYSRHDRALPLYTTADASTSLRLFRSHQFEQTFPVAPGITARLQPAGHILGSASVLLDIDDGDERRRLFVTGDVGRAGHPLLVAPPAPPAADVILTESTYGNRTHVPTEEDLETLARAVTAAAGRGGIVLLPAFAVDRTEVVLDAIRRLEAAGRIPALTVFVDSPMALDVLDVYRRAATRGGGGLRPDAQPAIGLDPDRLVPCRSVDDSKSLAGLTYPSIIISASGMATGGRVLHHLRRLLPDPANTVVFTGFQVEGTRGHRLVSGERSVKMFGAYVPVRADIHQLESFSVHADQNELIAWLGQAPTSPDVCHVVHGSTAAAEALQQRLSDELGWHAVVPEPGERVLL